MTSLLLLARSLRLNRTLRRLSLILALFLLPLTSFSTTRHKSDVPAAAAADTPSGFFPGIIHYFAGNGNGNVPVSNGSVPIQVSISGYTATDSHGNVYIATGAPSGIYVVYAGGMIPAALANVTTNATPSITPQAGLIYQIAGAMQAFCGACEGLALDQVGLVNIAGLVIDGQDNLYYSDSESNGSYADVVRKVDATTSKVTTVAGQWSIESSLPNVGDGGPGASATLFFPEDIKLDSYGNLYINDNFDDLVRVVYLGSQPPPLLTAEGITVGNSQQGYIYSVAGQPGVFCSTPGSCGDGGSANASASLGYEFSISVDAQGDLYIADAIGSDGPYIRAVYAGGTVPAVISQYVNPKGGNAVAPTGGYIYPVTGYSDPFYGPCTAAPCGDGGLAANALFGNSNLYLTADALGNLYISDLLGHDVRKIDASGYVSTIAGINNPNQTPPAVTPVPDGGQAVGTYLTGPSAISFDAKDNLFITDTNLIWMVDPLLPQSIDFPNFDPATVTYGTTPISFSATASSELPVQYAVASTPSGIATLNGSELVLAGAGSVAVTASQAGDSSYAAAPSISHTLTVERAPLTVTANAASKLVGAPNPAFSAAISGFVNGDTSATPGVLSGAPTFTTTATTSSPEGDYPIVPSIGTLSSKNYSFPTANFIDGTLTVTGNQPQTISFPAFSPAAVPYGHGSITLGATSSSGGVVSFVLVSGPGALSGANSETLTITGAGAIVIQAIQEGYKNYKAATPVNQTLTVTPAQLTVTGPTVNTTYGVAIDPTTFPPPTVTGFVDSDSQNTVLTGSPQYSTTASGTPNVGTYAIVVMQGTLTLLPADANNYVFATPVNGSLIVHPASQTIQFNPISTGQVYGNIVALTASSTSGLPVTFTATGPAIFFNGVNDSLELKGVGTVTVTAIQTGNSNYQAAQAVVQTVRVSPAPLMIGLSQAYSREEGAPNPAFQFTVQGFVLSDTDIPSVISGVPLLTTAATQTSPPGVYPITPSQGTLVAPNYSFVFVPGTLTVTPPGSFSITASPASLTIASGLSAQTTLTITPANFYQGTVTLSCGQLPANITCVVSPSTYVFPGNQAPTGVAPIEYNAQGTLTISASGSPVSGALRQLDSTRLASLWFCPSAVCGLMLLLARRRVVARSGVWGVIAVFSLGLGLLVATSCGGSSHSLKATPGTSQIMIQGSGTSLSGNSPVTATLPLTITVQ